jgi:23S rRNA pseudouridine2605 synthase
VELEDGPARAISARVTGRARGRGAVRIVVAEGRKREVRRMLAAVGLPVRRLVRLRYGPIRLGRMPAGRTRELSSAEVRALYGVAGL